MSWTFGGPATSVKLIALPPSGTARIGLRGVSVKVRRRSLQRFGHQAAIDEHGLRRMIDLRAGFLEDRQRARAHQLDAEILQNVQRRLVDRLDLVGRQKLHRRIRVCERAATAIAESRARPSNGYARASGGGAVRRSLGGLQMTGRRGSGFRYRIDQRGETCRALECHDHVFDRGGAVCRSRMRPSKRGTSGSLPGRSEGESALPRGAVGSDCSCGRPSSWISTSAQRSLGKRSE